MTGDSDADLAYEFAGDTYNYYASVHGRDSFDDAGATIVSSVHFCKTAGGCPYQNAFWNGTQMVYGEGFSAADDVDAHELTHAVTERTASLFYYMQSGALNESFSDIFGETVDLTNGSGTDTAGVRWLLGEDVPGFGAPPRHDDADRLRRPRQAERRRSCCARTRDPTPATSTPTAACPTTPTPCWPTAAPTTASPSPASA